MTEKNLIIEKQSPTGVMKIPRNGGYFFSRVLFLSGVPAFRLRGSPGPRIFGSSRICGKRHVDGNQTILVWHALVSKRRHIRDMGPEQEALVAFSALHKSALNRIFKRTVIPAGARAVVEGADFRFFPQPFRGSPFFAGKRARRAGIQALASFRERGEAECSGPELLESRRSFSDASAFLSRQDAAACGSEIFAAVRRRAART